MKTFDAYMSEPDKYCYLLNDGCTIINQTLTLNQFWLLVYPLKYLDRIKVCNIYAKNMGLSSPP